MKILFDCRYTRLGRHDGISRYTSRMVEELAKLHPVTMIIYDKRQLELLPDLPWVRGTHPRGLGEPLGGWYLNRYHPDVVFTPMQTIGPWGRNFALVTTIHDLIYYTHRTPPGDLNAFTQLVWRGYHLWWGFQRGLLNRADAHLADSETTKRLMEANRATKNPVSVVHLGTDAPAKVPQRTPPAARELVYMGSFMAYKGVDVLVRALHRLPGYRLRLMSRVTAQERATLERLAPAGSLEFLDGASDAEYADALDRAVALVSASREEGFGLPVIESMVRGTPVIVRDLPIFREIGGEAAHYFVDEIGLVDELRALEDPGEWERRSRASVAHAAAFTWEAAAAQLLRVLREAVARRGSAPRTLRRRGHRRRPRADRRSG
jgi:glycosyltransferase involved in cell wall biosynthesis